VNTVAAQFKKEQSAKAEGLLGFRASRILALTSGNRRLQDRRNANCTT
jgi:hypothetical protein